MKLISSIVLILLLSPFKTFAAVTEFPTEAITGSENIVLEGTVTAQQGVYCLSSENFYTFFYVGNKIKVVQKIIASGTAITVSYDVYKNDQLEFIGCPTVRVDSQNINLQE